MDEDIIALLIPIIAVTGFFVWMMLASYFKHKERMMGHMSDDQIAELDQMSRRADILDRRVAVLENILDDEIPSWRESYDKTI